MPTIRVVSSLGAYTVHCGAGVLVRAASLIERLRESTGTFIVSSPNVWRRWGVAIAKAIPSKNARRPILFDDAESSKHLASVEGIARQLVHAGADRRAILVAVGGGVVGDVAGFAAATYLRGVGLVHVPTTLVAQVDSAIGGKTGVDLPEGKNLVGAFYPPKLVITDPTFLETVPSREYRSGLYEVIKYGVIRDLELFRYLERRMEAILRRDSAALAWIIRRSIAIKARVVGEDEREGGLRQILNFGHTLGHALETATHYRRFLHGEAIGWGMIAATLLAVAHGQLSNRDAARIIRLIACVGRLPPIDRVRAASLRPILASDKKSLGGRVRWVLPQRIGKTRWGVEVPWPVVARTFRELPCVEVAAVKEARLRREPTRLG
jgi:3-dehydroquinate synthase